MPAMIHVAFAFNFNIQRSAVDVGEERPIIDQGYAPLLALLLEHGARADLFVSGFSSLTLREMDPGVLQTIRQNLGGAFELGTYTYTHPIPQLLEPAEMARQIRKGLQIDREVFGVSPAGFLPPELAFTYDMARVLRDEGLQWVVVLASLLQKALPGGEPGELYTSCTAASRDVRLTVVPAAYQLPGLPARFFKLMMKGQLPVEDMVAGVRRFAEEHPGALLLFKRDAETIFIDALNSGFTGTEKVFEAFVGGLAALPEVRFVTIGQFITAHPPRREVELPDFLGNTKIETFTTGEAQPIWDLTRRVRKRLLEAERRHPGAPEVEKAWEHLLLSHNSDGRIGYWISEWNPGEHVVAPGRRRFVEENLQLADRALEGLG
jgi:alpha-amylase/alpha-mannosidase (GH57 family)